MMTGESEIKIIRTVECYICHRFDSIMITSEELKNRIQEGLEEYGLTDIGTYELNHVDHIRTAIYNENGKYLGDHITLIKESFKHADNEKILQSTLKIVIKEQPPKVLAINAIKWWNTLSDRVKNTIIDVNYKRSILGDNSE